MRYDATADSFRVCGCSKRSRMQGRTDRAFRLRSGSRASAAQDGFARAALLRKVLGKVKNKGLVIVLVQEAT